MPCLVASQGKIIICLNDCLGGCASGLVCGACLDKWNQSHGLHRFLREQCCLTFWATFHEGIHDERWAN